jgi:putative membrane protein insertion efficiency factor
MPDKAARRQHPRPGLAQRLALGAIRGYQLAFAPMYAGSCRYLPSCSDYAREAIERHGVLRGGALAMRRLMRCHPFGGHGLDPVPAYAVSELRPGRPDPAPSERPLCPPADGSSTH